MLGRVMPMAPKATEAVVASSADVGGGTSPRGRTRDVLMVLWTRVSSHTRRKSLGRRAALLKGAVSQGAHPHPFALQQSLPRALP